MGIHCGEADERDGDYFGPVLNRAARIMSAGHGGQILLSSIAADAIYQGDGIALNDLGIHHLKDLDEPEHIYEVRHADLPAVTKSIRTVDIRRHNLPDYLNSFVGRDAEFGELADLIARNRLVTLTGVGGTGKTRLALETARRTIDSYPDGAWIVQLAPVTNPQFIMSAVGEVWNLRPGEGATIEDVVTRFLWSRELLVIIDNCEHLLDGATATIKFLLDACPKLSIVATSRESLGIPGEAILRVPSLGLGDKDHPLEESEAVRLFIDRAHAIQPGFEPTSTDLSDIGRICTRIDGIPLGLELAAARLRSLSPSELADRLEQSFRILSGSAKAALPRQRTLHATIDWSFDLLKPPEQALFRRLSVFTAGFDLAAAEAVCAGDDVEDWEVLDHLDSLIDKSLVTPLRDEAGQTRYRLLEPVRQYSQEQLSASGESERFRLAHARYFAAFVRHETPGMRSPDITRTQHRIDLDYDNVRTALATFDETDHLDAYLDTAFDLFTYWMHKGMQVEAIELALRVLESTGASRTDPHRTMKCWWTTAVLSAELTRPEGIRYAQAGLDLAKTLDDPNAVGRMELALGATIRHATTDPEYLEHLIRGRTLLDQHRTPHWWDEPWDVALNQVLLAAYLPLEDERAEEHLEAALTGLEAYGDVGLHGAMLSDGAGYYYLTGQTDRGLAMAARAAEVYADLDSPNWYGHVLQTWATLLHLEGEFGDAKVHFIEAAQLLDMVGDVDCWAASSRGAALCEVETSALVSAAGRVLATIERMPSLPMQDVNKPRTIDAAAAIVLASNRPGDGARLLGAAIAAPFPASGSVIRPKQLERIRAKAVSILGQPDTERLLAEGARLTIDQALDLAEQELRRLL
jgi:predicted ATPase